MSFDLRPATCDPMEASADFATLPDPEAVYMTHEIDQLAFTAVFGDEKAKAEARKEIHLRARKSGAVSSSIYPLYKALGRNEVRKRFTVPAFNIRILTYDTARALFRAAMRHNVGPFIFEIA